MNRNLLLCAFIVLGFVLTFSTADAETAIRVAAASISNTTTPINWVLRSPVVSPPVVFSPGMAYDSKRGVTVLFGGAVFVPGGQMDTNDTWEWDGVAWIHRHREPDWQWCMTASVALLYCLAELTMDNCMILGSGMGTTGLSGFLATSQAIGL